MLDRFAAWVTHHPKLVVLFAVLLLIPSLLGYIATGVNYDILEYLPEDLESVQGEEILDKTFHLSASTFLIVENMQVQDTEAMREKILQVDGVQNAVWIYSILGSGIPESFLPDAVHDALYSKDGDATLMLIQHEQASASEQTMAAVDEIRTIANKQCYLSGMSAMMTDIKQMTDEQAPIFISIAIALALLVMFLCMDSFILPPVLLVTLLFAVAYNMGTNFFLGEISFLTQAVAAVLQLAVTMDYSVFLIDRYTEEKPLHATHQAAMQKAVKSTFTALTGSSMTTVFGFLALCFMRLSLGFDIGFVMAKGVVLGVATVVIVLPAMLLILDRYLERFQHRSLLPKFEKLSQFTIRHRKVLVTAMFVLLIPAYFLQGQVDMYYSMNEMMPQDLPSIVGLNAMKEDFDMATTHFALVDAALPANEMTQMLAEVEDVEGVSSVMARNSIVGPGVPESMIPQDLLEICKKDGKQLMMCTTQYTAASDEANQQIDEITAIMKAYDPEGLLTGEGVMYKDMLEITGRDFQVTNIISIVAILLLVGLVFRSVSLPVIIVLSIELAIFINLAISYLTGSTIAFIAPTVISCVQLGATVDYAILLTTRFREELQKRPGKRKEAMQIAASSSARSILQSAMVFFIATFGICLFCDITIVQGLCALLARGALISMAVILLFFVPLLYVCEPLVARTTYHWMGNKAPHEHKRPGKNAL